MENTRIRRGDIFLANLDPVVGSEQGGTRPVLIIQNNTGNQFSPTVIVAIITTKQKGTQPTHIHLGTQFGLPEDSTLSAEQPRTLDKTRLLHYIGHVDKHTMYEVNRALKISMDLLRNEPNRITLCRSCASAFYNSGSHVIRRADYYQSSKSICDYCNSRYGFDYWLTDKIKRKPAKGDSPNGNQRLSPR